MANVSKWFAFVALTLPLTGCSAFHVTEQNLNQEVSTRLAQGMGENRIQLNTPEGVFDLALLVKNVDVDLTSRDGGLIELEMDTDIQGMMTVFGRDVSFKTQIVPSFESGVRLHEKDVYLVAPKLTNIAFQGNNISDAMLREYLGGIHDEFEQAVAQYFDEHPIYRLEHSAMEKMAARLVSDIMITDDTIEFLIF